MNEAKFINTEDTNIIYKCNICSENIENDQIIGLKCNPLKHIFCYECINEWYISIKNKQYNTNYTMRNMCPICRKSGGLLPLYNTPYIKGIHQIFNTNNTIKLNEVPKECGVKFKTKEGCCKSIGKPQYGGFCGIHGKKSVI